MPIASSSRTSKQHGDEKSVADFSSAIRPGFTTSAPGGGGGGSAGATAAKTAAKVGKKILEKKAKKNALSKLMEFLGGGNDEGLNAGEGHYLAGLNDKGERETYEDENGVERYRDDDSIVPSKGTGGGGGSAGPPQPFQQGPQPITNINYDQQHAAPTAPLPVQTLPGAVNYPGAVPAPSGHVEAPGFWDARGTWVPFEVPVDPWGTNT